MCFERLYVAKTDFQALRAVIGRICSMYFKKGTNLCGTIEKIFLKFFFAF